MRGGAGGLFYAWGRRGVGGEGGLCWEWVVWGFMRVGGLFYAWERVMRGVGVGVGFMGVGFMRGRGSRLYAWGCGGFVLCVGVGVEWVVREGFVGSGCAGGLCVGMGVGFMRGGAWALCAGGLF